MIGVGREHQAYRVARDVLGDGHLPDRLAGRDHLVTVEVRRMGGGFGGKETQPAQFAAAVDDVLRHPQQQLALAEAARSRLLARYAWDKLGTELAEFYTKFV